MMRVLPVSILCQWLYIPCTIIGTRLVLLDSFRPLADLLQSPQLTRLKMECNDARARAEIAKLKPLRLGSLVEYSSDATFNNPRQRMTRNAYVPLLVYVAIARIRAWARGTAGASLLMQTPMEVFTHILSSADMFEIGLPRWTLAAIVRFLFQDRAEAERRCVHVLFASLINPHTLNTFTYL